jgi:hypothetical protein
MEVYSCNTTWTGGGKPNSADGLSSSMRPQVELKTMQKLAKAVAALIMLCSAAMGAVRLEAQHSYAGFDKDSYPGDAALAALRQSFRFAGFWLNNPPDTPQNGWAGKRALLKNNGFGFLVLFNGRLDAVLKGKDAAALGKADGKAAAAAAAREGFAANVRIFLDQEEGGRLLPEQAAYLFAWVDAVRAAGARAGIYCSGIDVPDGKNTISTARDIAEREKARARISAGAEHLALWIANVQCPPAPGCTLKNPPLSAIVTPSLKDFATVWQYAESPRRAEFSAGCPKNNAPDGNCYAPGMAQTADAFVDLNTADSADPSEEP